MTASHPAPPVDPEVDAAWARLGVGSGFTADMIAEARAESAAFQIEVLDRIAPLGLDRRDVTLAAADGGAIPVSVFTPPGPAHARPAIFYVHGGGMVSGDRFSGMDFLSAWARELDVVVVTVDYRLAPEFPDPTPVEDVSTALGWTFDAAATFGIDRERIIIAGVSAGGGLAAGAVLLARERGGPQVRAQMLLCPMLDDRGTTPSTAQVDGVGSWDRTANDTAWTALLGARRGTDHVSMFAAPARAEDLSRLPATYIDVGTVEVFRDECVEFARAIWCAGGVADLHVWAGGIHAYEQIAPDAAISRETVHAREAWLRRILQSSGQED